MANCLSKKSWHDLMERLNAFDIVFKAKKRHQTLVILSDGVMFYKTEELEEAIDEWKDCQNECE